MHRSLRRIVPLLLLALSALRIPAHAQGGGGPRASDRLVADAQAFMASYAEDLLAGRRDAIAARYDRRGAYRVGLGEKELQSFDSIGAMYRGRMWGPPVSFAWHDLSYEVVGPDAVVVTGLFDWGAAADRKIRVSYTGLLVRQDGRLVIRLEDESYAPPRRPAPAAAPAPAPQTAPAPAPAPPAAPPAPRR